MYVLYVVSLYSDASFSIRVAARGEREPTEGCDINVDHIHGWTSQKSNPSAYSAGRAPRSMHMPTRALPNLTKITKITKPTSVQPAVLN